MALAAAVIVAIAAAVGLALLLSGDDGPPADLSPRFASGTSSTYRLRASDDAEPTEELPEGSHLDLSTTVTVAGSDGQESATIVEVTVGDIDATFNGAQELAVAIAEPQTLELDARARPDRLLVLGASADGTFFYYFDLLVPVVPERQSSVGDRWPIAFEASVPAATGSASYEGMGEFAGYEDVDGVRAAEVRNEITFSYDLTASSPEIAELSGLGSVLSGTIATTGGGSLTLTAWIDPATGRLLRAMTEGTYELRYSFRGFDEEESGFTEGDSASVGEFGSTLELVA